MAETDSTLVRRVLARETSAYDELVRRHRPGLIRCIALMIGDLDDAESLAQEALTRAFAQLAGFRSELSFGAWLRGIALNLSRNHLRARRRHAKPTAPDQLSQARPPGSPPPGVLSGIVRQEVNEQAQQAISQLPAPFAEAFVLHFVEGLDYAEISQITGVAPGTLRVRSHRARTLLRNSLGSVVDTWMREGRRE
jgi:RNA polymerase sigma-70 factor (ECF subfamily)